MASPGELVRCVANVLGVPEATVVQHDRNLLIGGHRTKGGRGRSAAKVTAADAAKLLISVAGSSYVKDTLPALRDYAQLPVSNLETSSRDRKRIEAQDGPAAWSLSISRLDALPPSHTFLEALTATLESAADGSLLAFAEKHQYPGLGGPRPPMFFVTLFGPFPQARIRISSAPKNQSIHYASFRVEGESLSDWARGFEGPPGDLSQIREFTATTVFAIGDLLRG